MNFDIKCNPIDLIHWFNAIRELPDCQKRIGLEAFWYGQIISKTWLVDTLNRYIDKPSEIYIFGGWIGVLSSLFFQCSKFDIIKITSIDLDHFCEPISKTICKPYLDRFIPVTMNMANFTYDKQPNIVINTSTEHITQETYNQWYNNIPNKTIIVVQGNNFFDCDQHIRCSKSLTEFKLMNNVPLRTIYEGTINCEIYNRFMCIYTKH